MKYRNAGGVITRPTLSNATNAVAEFVIVVDIEVNYAHATTKTGLTKATLVLRVPSPMQIRTTAYRLMHRIML